MRHRAVAHRRGITPVRRRRPPPPGPVSLACARASPSLEGEGRQDGTCPILIMRPGEGLSNSSSSCVTIAASSSTIEEVPAAVRATHRSPEECIKQATMHRDFLGERNQPQRELIYEPFLPLQIGDLLFSCSCSIGRAADNVFEVEIVDNWIVKNG